MALFPRPAICCSVPLVGPVAMREAVLAVRGLRSGASSSGGAGSEMRGGSVRLSGCMTGRTPRPVPGFPLHVLRCSGPGAGRHVVAGDLVLQRTPASRGLACRSGPLGASRHRCEAGGLDVPGATPSRAYARLLGRAVHDRLLCRGTRAQALDAHCKGSWPNRRANIGSRYKLRTGHQPSNPQATGGKV